MPMPPFSQWTGRAKMLTLFAGTVVALMGAFKAVQPYAPDVVFQSEFDSYISAEKSLRDAEITGLRIEIDGKITKVADGLSTVLKGVQEETLVTQQQVIRSNISSARREMRDYIDKETVAPDPLQRSRIDRLQEDISELNNDLLDSKCRLSKLQGQPLTGCQ